MTIIKYCRKSIRWQAHVHFGFSTLQPEWNSVIFCCLFCRPSLWEDESPLWPKSMQRGWCMRREPQRICMSLLWKIWGPALQHKGWLWMLVIFMLGQTNLLSRVAREGFILLICFILVGHKHEMAFWKLIVLKPDQTASFWKFRLQLLFAAEDELRNQEPILLLAFWLNDPVHI